jgi:hypothetical protein
LAAIVDQDNEQTLLSSFPVTPARASAQPAWQEKVTLSWLHRIGSFAFKSGIQRA